MSLFKWYLNRQWMCKTGVGSAAILQTLMVLEYSKTQTEMKVNWKTEIKFGVRNAKGLGTWEVEGPIELSQEPGVTMRSHTRKRLLCQ